MATFTVTTALDVVDAGDGRLSLREAVTQANATTTADTIAFAAGLTTVAYVAVAAALAAAFLNAAFGFCLGCEFYLAFRRLFPSQPNTTEVAS